MSDDTESAGSEPAVPLSVGTVLVPVDGSEESVTALEYAGAIADRYEAGVHAVYVLSEEVVRGIESDALDPESVAADAQAFIDDASAVVPDGVDLSTSTAYGFSTSRKMVHPGSVVLDCADEVEADFLVVPREPVGGDPDEVLSKAAEYVLLYASQPVLSV